MNVMYMYAMHFKNTDPIPQFAINWLNVESTVSQIRAK